MPVLRRHLCKPDKVTLDNVPSFQHSDNITEWVEQLFNPILQHQGGAALQQWIHEENYVVSSLEPPPATLHVAVELVELNYMYMDYTDMESLALQLLMRKLALSRATQEQQLVWEALLVLDEGQHRERDQDIARM